MIKQFNATGRNFTLRLQATGHPDCQKECPCKLHYFPFHQSSPPLEPALVIEGCIGVMLRVLYLSCRAMFSSCGIRVESVSRFRVPEDRPRANQGQYTADPGIAA